MTDIHYDDFEPDELGGGGGLPPGKYHCLIQEVEPNDGTDDDMQVCYEVVAGDTEDCEGRQKWDYFKKGGKGAKRTLLLALATGLTTMDELKAARKRKDEGEGSSMSLDFKSAVGRSVCIEVKLQAKREKVTDDDGNEKWQDTDQKVPRVDFAVYSPDDERVKQWPKNAAYLGENGTAAPTTADEFAGID